jgi:hypothetical protein
MHDQDRKAYSQLRAQADSTLDVLKARVIAKGIEVVPDLDQDEVSFAERTRFLDGIEGEINFAKSLVSDDEGHLRNVARFGEFLELGQAHARSVELTRPSVSSLLL